MSRRLETTKSPSAPSMQDVFDEHFRMGEDAAFGEANDVVVARYRREERDREGLPQTIAVQEVA